MMGTTAKGYPYPEGTDLVVDGDDAIQALAEAVDTKQPAAQAVGIVEFTKVEPGNAKSLAITFPAGLFTGAPFITLGMYTAVPGEKSTSTTTRTTTGFTIYAGYTGVSTSVTYRVMWQAVQMDAPPAVNLLADEGPGAAADAIVTCPTADCTNQGIPIEVSTHWTDDETGETRPVDGVQCGVCGTDITASVQEA